MTDGKKSGGSDKAPNSARRDTGKIDPTVQGQIGSQLRDMYDHVLNEPVPDRFLSLLRQLEERDGGKGEKDE